MSDTRPVPAPGDAAPEPGPPPPRPPRPPLRRSRTDRVLGGVCGGLGRYFDIDPILIRILFVVLTIFSGGLFLVVWIVLLLAVPEEPAEHGQLPATWSAAAPQPVYAAAGAGAPPGFAAGGAGQYTDPTTGRMYGPPPAARPRTEPRSYLGLVAVSAAVVVGGALALVASLGADIPAVVVLGAMLAVLAAALVVGAWRGRARWLVAVALPLLLVTGAASAVHRAGPDLSFGDRTWVPTTLSDGASYNLGSGTAVLDLRRLSHTGEQLDLRADVGAGRLRVLVPTDVRLVLDGHVGVGQITVTGQPGISGLDNSTRVTLQPVGSPTTVTTVDLTAEVGIGNLEVRRATS